MIYYLSFEIRPFLIFYTFYYFLYKRPVIEFSIEYDNDNHTIKKGIL